MAERNIKPAVLQSPSLGPVDLDLSPTRSAAMTFVEDYLALDKIAAGIMASNFAPKGLKDKADIVLILMTGQELGLSYAQALRMMYVVNGRPTLAADAMAAVVKRFCAMKGGGYLRVTEQTSQRCTVEFKRHDEETVSTVSFTIDDAKAANLLGKDVWKQYPQDMLRARATSRACRTGWPDVLGGVYDPDEMGDAYEATISGGEKTQRARVQPVRNAEQELIASGQEIIDAPARETRSTASTAPATPPAAPTATVSAPAAPPVAADGPMSEATRRALYAAGKDRLGWGADEVFALISATYDVADVWQLTDKQARALTKVFTDQPDRARAKLAAIQGTKTNNDDLVAELLNVAESKGVSGDQLVLIAWRRFGVSALYQCSDAQLEELDQILQLDESKLTDVVLEAEEIAKQAQPKK